MRPREVFLSHATADRVLAQRIIRSLGAHRIRVWYAPYKLIGSQTWHDQIGAALERCDWFVVLLSKSSVRSRWVKNELLFALNEPTLEDRIVPVLIQDCDWRRLSWTLGAIQRVDFRGDFRVGTAALLRVWGLGADPPRRRGNRPAT
jgi:hypothetical protein